MSRQAQLVLFMLAYTVGAIVCALCMVEVLATLAKIERCSEDSLASAQRSNSNSSINGDGGGQDNAGPVLNQTLYNQSMHNQSMHNQSVHNGTSVRGGQGGLQRQHRSVGPRDQLGCRRSLTPATALQS